MNNNTKRKRREMRGHWVERKNKHAKVAWNGSYPNESNAEFLKRTGRTR